jgi:hypothetical protein
LADEEALTDVLRNGLYQERRDAVRDPDPHAVVNLSDARMRTIDLFSNPHKRTQGLTVESG